MTSGIIKEKQAQEQKLSATRMVREVKDGRDTTQTVQRWDRFLASKEAEAGGAFSQALAAHERSGAWAAFARETFSKLYDSGLSKDLDAAARPLGHEWVAKLHESAEALPEWRALRERARRDAWACGVASGEALNVIASTVKPPDADPQDLQDQLDFVKGLMSEGGGKQTSPKHLKRMAVLQRQIADAKDEHARAAQMLDAKGAGLRSAMRKAAMKAQETIQEMDDAMATLGAGEGTGTMSRVQAPPAQLRSALQRNVKLRRIIKLAGRMKSAAIAKQRSKATPGREELCDITASADIDRLIPSELLNLAEPETELVLYRRLAERSALTYELRGRETKAEGPIIMAVDESGSMSGQRDEWAKAVAIALMEIAARQNRPFAYVHFDDRVTRTDEVKTPRSLSLQQLEELVTYFTGGGTSIGAALSHCAGMMEKAHAERDKPWKRADVVLVTDGDCYEVDAQVKAVERIRKLNGHVYSIFIDAYHYGEDEKTNKQHVAAWSDEKLYINTGDISSADPTKLGKLFSM